MNALLVFVKYPQPGRVKTRLCPPLNEEEACEFYQAMLLDSLEAYRRLDGVTLLPQIEPPARRDDFAALLGEDLALVDQCEGDLGVRMAHAFDLAFSSGARKAVVIGTDHPSLPLAWVRDAFAALDQSDTAVIGPAEDGGYYLLGLSGPRPGLFENVPWSGPEVLARTEENALKSGLMMEKLAPWYDVDDLAGLSRLRKDLENKAVEAPRSREALEKLLAWGHGI